MSHRDDNRQVVYNCNRWFDPITVVVVEMAAKESTVVESIDDGIPELEIEPGASSETMLVTTDSFDEYEQEMSSSIDPDRQMKESTTSTISEIQDIAQDVPPTTTPAGPREAEKTLSLDDSETVGSYNLLSLGTFASLNEICLFSQGEHVF